MPPLFISAPLFMPAHSFLPSADETTDCQKNCPGTEPGTLFEVQVVPELVEVAMVTVSAERATSLEPSAEEATEAQFHSTTGTLFEIKDFPVLVEL